MLKCFKGFMVAVMHEDWGKFGVIGAHLWQVGTCVTVWSPHFLTMEYCHIFVNIGLIMGQFLWTSDPLNPIFNVFCNNC